VVVEGVWVTTHQMLMVDQVDLEVVLTVLQIIMQVVRVTREDILL
tara:strand:+ start:144 stop:278 length:135 start_codon:yes stop_codon:yes gene_type:complete